MFESGAYSVSKRLLNLAYKVGNSLLRATNCSF